MTALQGELLNLVRRDRARRPKPPIWYRTDAYSPMPRRLHGVHSWRWEIRDGDADGPLLADGTTLTRWGARRQREAARARCQRRILHPHTTRHRLSAVEATTICDDLAELGVRITIRRTRDAVDVWPAAGPIDTAGEVYALRALKAATDQPVRWHAEAVAG